jgi:hypothetical protein
MDFPTTTIENVTVSRLVIGSNWLMGYSHQSAAKDRWIRQYMTLERIVAVLKAFIGQGVNCILSGTVPLMHEAMHVAEEETGVKLHWMCTPNGEHVQDLMPGIEQCAEWGATFCMPHQHWTDGNMVVNEQRIIGLEQVTQRIRELGMIPGLSTHRPETVVVCDRAGYDVASYIQIYNALGFLCQIETDWIAKVINGTTKPVVCIKPLAAGRLMPETGLSFVFNSIKANDLVSIGCMSPDEAEADIRIAREIIEHGAAQTHDLAVSRSKGILAY